MIMNDKIVVKPRIKDENRSDKVLCVCWDEVKVVIWEAEVTPCDVVTRRRYDLIKEWRETTEKYVHYDPHTPKDQYVIISICDI